jgi:TfoX/Sxy family transcriptional regulator of competence genes
MVSGTGSEMPKWQPASDEIKRQFEEAILPLPGAEVRKMFGYPAAFYNGQMFACVFGEQMIVRLPEAEKAELLSRPGASPFEPMPGRVMREYVVLPAAAIADVSELDEWLHRALAYVAALPPKVAKTPKKPKAKGQAKSDH